MLTREQIRKIAVRTGISLFPQERDYIQTLFLFSLSKLKSKIIFKGGTCLRIVYKSNRYSEDLDFNSYETIEELKNVQKQILSGLGDFGIICEIKNENQSNHGYSYKLSYKGPLYDGSDRSKGSVKIDYSLRNEVIDKESSLIRPDYEDLYPYMLDHMSKDHILAEKVRALIIRGKARDLYDLWFLFNLEAKFSKDLADKKLSIYNKKFLISEFKAGLSKIEREWKRDLEPLLLTVPEFAVVKKLVLDSVRR